MSCSLVVDGTDFVAAGDGATDDTSVFTDAFNYAISLGVTSPAKIWMPEGAFKITGPLPVLPGRVTVAGVNPLATKILQMGDFTPLSVKGNGSRAGWTVFTDFSVITAGATSAYTVALDWCQNVVFDRVHLYTPFNGVSIRQAGNITFQNSMIDTISGRFGVYAYGTNLSRNGQNDQIDLVMFYNTVVQGNYDGNGTPNSSTMVCLDGRVQSIQCDGLKLLSGGKGMIAVNTPNVPADLISRFIVGSGLEIESMYINCLDLEYCNDVNLAWLFAARSYGDGIYLGPNVGSFNILSGSINTHFGHGVNINNAGSVNLGNARIYNNSLVGYSAKSSVYVSGSTRLRGAGGTWGKNLTIPSYSEAQKFGLEMAPTYNGLVTLDGVDLRGNSVGSVYDSKLTQFGSSIQNCPGYNPIGASLVSVGASPFVYTAGLSAESINIYGGSGVVCATDGVAISNSSPTSFVLPPRKSVAISYATTPTISTLRS